MSSRKKSKLQSFIFYALNLVCLTGCGGAAGFLLATLEKRQAAASGGAKSFLLLLCAMAGFYACYFVSIWLHEVGHLIGGLLSGYRFLSIRFGKVVFQNENGRLRLARYSMPGTGGQCLMLAPEVDPKDMPVVLYNLGGLLMNLILALAGAIAFFCLKNTAPLASSAALLTGLLNLTLLITNGLPFTSLGTDGANAVILCKNKAARVPFANSLRILELLDRQVQLQDMPEELFFLDRAMPLDDPITSSQAFNRFNYLVNLFRFDEAKETGAFILSHATCIHQLHEKLICGELLFIASLQGDVDTAKTIFAAHKKEFKAIRTFISMQRIYCAYYTLVEPDAKQAEKYQKQFAKSVKNYPNKLDAQNEQRLFDLIAQKQKQ
ncbi:MAG: hypothetical protein HUJ80_01250 [Firmicutes bacterium]|nr:hypothetical protein [Bacillota bacterium]